MTRLVGMKEICEHMKRSESTVLKLRLEQDLPIVRIGGIWESDTEEIAKWHKQQINGAPPEQRGGASANGQKKNKKKSSGRFWR